MNMRKINPNIESIPGIYKSIEKCQLGIISIAPRSEVVNDYLKSKLLNNNFLISRFRKNMSEIIKNHFNENEITFLIVNIFDSPEFGKNMIRIGCQFPDAALFVKGKTKGYCFLDWKDRSVLETVKSRDFFEELVIWNGGNFLFQDVNLFQAN